ncbi:hypothetical protein M378DRAFT_164373 [Amanita muscaria Koide BX008]|uniref:Uncharacterized protein n=1 Tax=Amanita muscaria (strain Koide BX008) TaxID=946122 RepID=A0A0C2TA20_AMAMK|nr:hypothetical protein M378DRAFT_164373 [Amanita muscaria Koide BX008]
MPRRKLRNLKNLGIYAMPNTRKTTQAKLKKQQGGGDRDDTEGNFNALKKLPQKSTRAKMKSVAKSTKLMLEGRDLCPNDGHGSTSCPFVMKDQSISSQQQEGVVLMTSDVKS